MNLLEVANEEEDLLGTKYDEMIIKRNDVSTSARRVLSSAKSVGKPTGRKKLERTQYLANTNTLRC